jgi:mycothiol synthase
MPRLEGRVTAPNPPGRATDLPVGLSARPGSPNDAEAIFDIVAACELTDDGVVEVDRDDVVVGFERAGFDPSNDLLLVFDRDEPVAWTELYRRRAEADVRPSHRGRGIGSALLAWIESRARELGDADVGQTKTDANARARDLFLARGYEPTFTSWILRIALDEPPPPPEPIDRISIRPYRDEDAHAVHEMVDAAFSEWPGRDPEAFEIWAPQVFGHPAFAPDLSPLAFDGDELVGAAIANDVPDADEGWVAQLATKATHRHRGIARALLRTAFEAFHDRGRRIAGLSTDSRTGALALYEQVGMRVVRQYTRYTKRLR